MSRYIAICSMITFACCTGQVAAQTADSDLPPPPPAAAALPPVLKPTSSERPTNVDASFDLRFDGTGVAIGSVVPGGLADQGGLRADDLVLSIDGRTIANADEFRAATAGFEGRTIEIVVERNGRPQTISLLYPQTAPVAPQSVSANRSWIGVSLSPTFAERGALVSRVQESSPASRAGVRTGDVVLALNGEDVLDYRNLIDRIGDLIPNSSAELLIYRNGATLSVNTAVGRFEDSNTRAATENTPAVNYEAQRIPTSQELADARLIQLGDRIYRLERMVEALQDELRSLKDNYAAE